MAWPRMRPPGGRYPLEVPPAQYRPLPGPRAVQWNLVLRDGVCRRGDHDDILRSSPSRARRSTGRSRFCELRRRCGRARRGPPRPQAVEPDGLGRAVKLTDFGIAKDLDATARIRPDGPCGPRPRGPRAGPRDPEVSHRRTSTLGVLIYEMLTDQPPIGVDGRPEALRPQRAGAAAQRQGRGYPGRVGEVIVKLVAKSSSGRPWMRRRSVRRKRALACDSTFKNRHSAIWSTTFKKKHSGVWSTYSFAVPQ